VISPVYKRSDSHPTELVEFSSAITRPSSVSLFHILIAPNPPAMSSSTVPTSSGPRARLRDVVPNVWLGDYKTGPLNALTDVPGVAVHLQSIHSHSGSVNTGVTTILPRKDWFNKACYAGMFRLNGSGEMTGSHWIEETGLLHSPIIITNSFAVGAAYEGIYRYAVEEQAHRGDGVDWFLLPVVAETFDGWLNDLSIFAVRPEHILTGITEAKEGIPIPEGNTGGGTGMMCQGYKGGTGTSSRVVPGLGVPGPDGLAPEKSYTIAALVQANYGRQKHLRISGVPVGKIIADEDVKSAAAEEAKKREEEMNKVKDQKDGSIIIILATDAPLHPTQLQRIARRATIGLAKVGAHAHNPSGDIFLAFSTANEVQVQSVTAEARRVDPFKATARAVEVTDDNTLNALFEAAADATEEAIYNALCGAETMVGHKGHVVEALPLDRVKDIMAKYGYP
jgi:D-aminopeptidase